MLREMAQPSSALDTIYEGLFEGVHARVCALWGAATGQPAESEAVRLAVFATIGQILYFHVARPVVTRRMGWPAIGAAEAGGDRRHRRRATSSPASPPTGGNAP